MNKDKEVKGTNRLAHLHKIELDKPELYNKSNIIYNDMC